MRRSVQHTALAVSLLMSLGASCAKADEFPAREGDMWRASKLVGVNIYGPDQKKVGDINEVLMSRDGKAAYVVVGVGGFLGIGEKNVAIPYDKVVFSQEPMVPPTQAGTMAPANGTMKTTGDVGLGTPAATSLDAPATAPAGNGTMANTMAPLPPHPTTYPDHGTVTYTADQLKAAPTFAYGK